VLCPKTDRRDENCHAGNPTTTARGGTTSCASRPSAGIDRAKRLISLKATGEQVAYCSLVTVGGPAVASEGGEGVAYGNGLVRRGPLSKKSSPEILGAHGSGLQRRVLSRLLLHFRRIPLTRTSLGHWGIVGPARPAGAARTPRSGRGATLNFRQRVLWIEDDVIMGGRPGRRRPSAYAPLRIRSRRSAGEEGMAGEPYAIPSLWLIDH